MKLITFEEKKQQHRQHIATFIPEMFKRVNLIIWNRYSQGAHILILLYIVFTGILDCEDKVDDNPDDEILSELRQKQQELKAVSNYVVSVTKTLLDKAREEMKKQELKKKLATADAEVRSTPTKLEILQ